MEWINYHHLLYFYTVAREGSLAQASEVLQLAQSTISTQIHQLESTLDHKLFAKSGRRLVLTDSGRIAFRYAEEIFSLGREMLGTFKDRPIGKPLRLTVGIADVVPKLTTQRVLMPALELAIPVRMICKEGKPDKLLTSLALHELDVVLIDAPASLNIKVRTFNHLLGESKITFFGSANLADKYQRNFPASLNNAPILLPTANTVLRRSLDQWFEEQKIQPIILGEFEDSALLKSFGYKGLGLFPVATALTKEIISQYRVKQIGKAIDVYESLYAVTVDRKIKHPAVAAICESAKKLFFRNKGN